MRQPSEWVQSLKVGDKVAMAGGGWGREKMLATVVAISLTGRVKVQSGSHTVTFDKQGFEYGSRGTWRYQLQPVNDGIIQEIRGRKARQRLEYATWKTLTDEQAIAAVAALRAAGIPGFEEAGAK